MKLENQVVNLELAKRLKELGFEQESLFAWTELNGDWFIYYIDRDGGFSIPKSSEEKFISAYTVAELEEKLRKTDYEIIWDRVAQCYMTYKTTDKSSDFSMLCGRGMAHGENKADAMAKMLIYLKENKQI